MQWQRASGDVEASQPGPQRPLVAGRAYFIASAFALAAGVVTLAPPLTAWIVGATIASVGATRALAVWWQAGRLRRTADEALIAGIEPESSPLLGWRAAELVRSSNRRILARSLAGICAESEAFVLSTPLHRDGVRPHLERVRSLATRVGALQTPVTPRGMALVEQLICDGLGPLYARDKAGQLGIALERCLIALEPRQPAGQLETRDAGLSEEQRISTTRA